MRFRPSTQARGTTLLAAFAMLLVLAAAVTFARSDQSLRVAEDAMVLRHAERGSAATSIYRANLAIAVVASAADSSSTSVRAIEASQSALDRSVGASQSIDDPSLSRAADDLVTSHHQVVARLHAGEVAGADRLATEETLPLVGRLQEAFATHAAEASSRIDAEHASAGQTARMSSFIVALIAPVLALWAYRRSAQRRLESERTEAELARQRDLSAAQQDLISGMSHQLRTPLTGIYGFAEALVSDSATGTPDASFVREAGQTILGESNRLRAMVDDILVTARAQAGELAYGHAPYDLRAEIMAAVEPFVGLGATIEIDCPAATASGDRLRVRHVLRNLIDNALRHGRPPIRIVGVGGAEFELRIEDHGDGPPTGDVFRSFVHSGEDALITGSVGLGLSVCKALCDGMGIQLDMRRRDGVTQVVLRWQASAVTQPAENRSAVSA
ncbi:MAG: HAMP domain-containing sensor histidine kinase [Acidimicrobiia bacterium]